MAVLSPRPGICCPCPFKHWAHFCEVGGIYVSHFQSFIGKEYRQKTPKSSVPTEVRGRRKWRAGAVPGLILCLKNKI